MSNHNEPRRADPLEPHARDGIPSRRAVVGAAAWAAPAIALMVASPAAAASVPTCHLGDELYPWDEFYIVTDLAPYIVVHIGSVCVGWQEVEWSVSPANVATFADGSSVRRKLQPFNWYPVSALLSPVDGGMCTVTALSTKTGEVRTVAVEVTPAHAGAIAFSRPEYLVTSRDHFVIPGGQVSGIVSTHPGQRLPDKLHWYSTSRFDVVTPWEVPVDPVDGSFTIENPDVEWAGTLFAWAPGFGTASTKFTVAPPIGLP